MQIFHDTYFSMNTRFSAVWSGITEGRSNTVFEELKSLLDKYELTLSAHDEKGELFKLNKFAPTKAVKVTKLLFDTLVILDSYKKKSFGYFNPDYLNYNSQQTGNNLFWFDFKNRTVKYSNNNTNLDLGAIGKGIALEAIDQLLDQNKIENVFISFGESSILTKGKHPAGKYWPFGLCDLYNKEKILFSSIFNNHAASISSSRININRSGPIEYHVHDPKENKIYKNDKIIFVKGNSTVEAEVLSTASLIARNSEIEEMINNFEVEEMIRVTYNNSVPVIEKLK